MLKNKLRTKDSGAKYNKTAKDKASFFQRFMAAYKPIAI
jgi:hypothetical protein